MSTSMYRLYKFKYKFKFYPGKPYMDGELIKDCITVVGDTILPNGEAKDTMKSISLSRRSVTRRAEELSRNLQTQLAEKIRTFVSFSLALDESTDIVDTAQLAIFIRGVDSTLAVTEQMLSLQSMKDTTTGADILREVKHVIEEHQLDLTKLVSIATDGAPAMKGTNYILTYTCTIRIYGDSIDSQIILAY